MKKTRKTLYHNGFIHTLEQENDIRSCMVIDGAKISYIGDDIPADGKNPKYRISADTSDYTEKINLQGKHVYPALTDSHLHLLHTIILAASNFSICEITSEGVRPDCLSGLEQRVREYCSANPRQKLIIANGYIISAVREKRLPDRFELDRWTGNRAMIVYNIDGHSSSMSSKLMQMLSLPCGESDNGVFSGEAHEFMQGKVMNLIASQVTPSVLAKGIANFTNLCASYGIGRVCALDGYDDVKNDILTKLLVFVARRLDIEVRFYPEYMDFDKARPFFKKQRHARAGGCGVWELDGSVGSHSAAFYEPYRDNGAQGHCYYAKEKIYSKVAEALRNDIRLSCHAIGEAAIDQICEVYESLKEQLPHSGGMMRIDHFEFPSQKAIHTIKNLPLAITVQPGFAWIDRHFLKSYAQFLPESIVQRQLPLKELYEAGVCICGSSDSPIQSINPYDQMLGMTDFYLSGQSLTNYQALESYTVQPAKMLGELDMTGTLAEGKYADFFVTDCDLLKLKGSALSGCAADYTVLKGKRMKTKNGGIGELFVLLLKRGRLV